MMLYENYDKEKVEEFYEIFKLMANAKHAEWPDMVRTFTNLCGAYMKNGWRVVGITQAAFDSFKEINFERIPTKKDPVSVERAHIKRRYDWIRELFNTDWKSSEDWWNFIYENDKVILATTYENKMSDTQGAPLVIAYEIPDNGEYFCDQYIGCKYRKKVERALLEKFDNGELDGRLWLRS